MKIRDVLKAVTMQMGRLNVLEYLEDETVDVSGTDIKETINLLTGLTNLVISELAATYIPMVTVERVSLKDGKAYYKDFLKKVLSVREVYSTLGKAVPFIETASFLTADLSAVDIEYEFLPDNYGLDDDIGYSEKDIPSRVLSYGVAAEFAISEGRFEEAVGWHKRYVDGVAEKCLPKNSVIKKRSFI